MIDWLVLDVDGVVLDSDRAGDGHWSNELFRRFGIERAQLRAAFFQPHWVDIVTGRSPIEPLLARALEQIGSTTSAEEVLSCWFEADFVAIDDTVELARNALSRGVRVALATNQEHRRAAYLRQNLGSLFRFETMVVSSDIAAQKPDSEFFEAADRKLGLGHDSHVLFVDDSESNVEAAAEHGWASLLADPRRDWITKAEALLAS